MDDDFSTITVLIPRLKNGQAAAWNELVEMFQPGLIAKARRLLRYSKLARRVDAEQLVNIAVTKAWEKRGSLVAQSTRQVAGFLLTTLQRSFIDQCRPINLEASSPSWLAPAAGDDTPSEVMISNEAEARLHACLAELSPRHREVLVMRHVDGMKFREIADRLGTTTGAIAGAARDGLKLLTDRLNRGTMM